LAAGGLGALSRVAWRVPPREQAPRVRELLERALDIDPEYAWARGSYGSFYYAFAWEWEASLAMLGQAISLEPAGAESYVARAFPLMATGRVDSAVASVQKASELEPGNPLFVSTECWILYLAHRYEQSIDRCQFVVDSIANDYPVAHAIRAASEFALRFLEGTPTEAERDSAAQEILAALAPVERRMIWSEIGEPVWLAMLGRRDAALRLLEEEMPQPFFRPLRAANTYAWLDDMDEAWSWLERAYEDRDPNLAESAVRPEMKPFWDDPRWPAFKARMNLD